MKLYHRTTEEHWKKIQESGCLNGKLGGNYGFISLAECDWGEYFSFNGWKTDVLLEVDYEFQGRPHDQYDENFLKEKAEATEDMCIVEFKVFVPIPISQVRRIN